MHYPIYSDLTSVNECVNYLPETLRVLLGIIIAGKDTNFKVASIGQAIMQACRPRVLLVPLQLGLGIQLHHHFSSRFLIDSLHHHGFCSSYNDVQQFECDAAFTHNVSVPNFTTQFMQYCVIKNFVRKLLIGHLMFNLSHYHQHLLQQSIILFMFIVKYNSGWEEMFLQKNGGGKEVEIDLCLSEQILLQL